MVPTSPWSPSRTGCAAQARLADSLGIERFAAVMGGSLGGMQALAWSYLFPERLGHCVVTRRRRRGCRRRTSPSTKSRGAPSSPTRTFHGGRFYDHGVVPERGLQVARMIGHITYLSDDTMAAKFGRLLQERRLQLFVRGRVRDRELPALPGGEVLALLRRQHLPPDHPRARLFRSRRGITAATSPRRWRRRAADSSSRRSPPTGDFRRRAATRSSRRCSPTRCRSPTPRSMRRTATTPSCSTIRSTTRWCAPTSSAMRGRRPVMSSRPHPAGSPEDSAAAAVSRHHRCRPDLARHRRLDRGRQQRPRPRLRRRRAARAPVRGQALPRLRRRDRRRRGARLRPARRRRRPAQHRGRARRCSAAAASTWCVLSMAIQATHRTEKVLREMSEVAAKASSRSPTSATGTTSGRSCSGGCRSRGRCPTSGTTRRTCT